MLGEELLLLAAGVFHRQVQVDVLLRTVHHANEPELERVCPTRKNVEGVSASVHEVELGEHTERAKTTGVNRASQLERVRVGQVDVGWGNGEDDPKCQLEV